MHVCVHAHICVASLIVKKYFLDLLEKMVWKRNIKVFSLKEFKN